MSRNAKTPASGRSDGDGPAKEEPVIAGTLFLTTLLLIMIFGFWAMMYVTLIHR
ncbi:MAG: cytochrome c oxidase subunit 2A [Thermoanaerobaculia bacterium]|nr:cytochrome c oxidase subunit 2A [Thermoanaerobaculia bacterium]